MLPDEEDVEAAEARPVDELEEAVDALAELEADVWLAVDPEGWLVPHPAPSTIRLTRKTRMALTSAEHRTTASGLDQEGPIEAAQQKAPGDVRSWRERASLSHDAMTRRMQHTRDPMYPVSISRAEGLQEKTKHTFMPAKHLVNTNLMPAGSVGAVWSVELGRCLPFDPSPPGL